MQNFTDEFAISNSEYFFASISEDVRFKPNYNCL